MTLLYAIVGYLLLVIAVVLVHELGHLLVAKAFRIRVKRFSVGFGRPLLTRKSRIAGEWALSAIPLGGYVQFATRSDPESSDAAADGERYFRDAPTLPRLAVILAGPVANMLLAWAVIAGIALSQPSTIAPVLVQVMPGSLLDQAGLQTGDRVLAIDGRNVSHLGQIHPPLLRNFIQQHPTEWIIDRAGTVVTTKSAAPSLNKLRAQMFQAHGLTSANLDGPTVVLALRDPVHGVRVQAGDRIVAVNGMPTPAYSDFIRVMRSKRAGAIHLRYERRGDLHVDRGLIPRVSVEDGVPRLGIQVQLAARDLPKGEPVSPASSVLSAGLETLDMAVVVVAGIRQLLSGQLGIEAIAGPVQIAQISGDAVSGVLTAAEWGRAASLLALFSISVAVINLLPLPLADGGQALITIWEHVRGRALSHAAQQTLQYMGIAMAGALMMLAAYSDFRSITGAP